MIQVLLLLIIYCHCSSAQSSSSCPCFSKSRFVAALQAKGSISCYNAVNRLTSIGLSNTPRVTITTISRPIDILVVGNDVYVTSADTARIYKLDQDGNELDVVQLTPSGITPRFLELHDNKIYITTIGSQELVLVSSDINSNNPLVFTTLLSLPIDPNSIRFTPDGNHFLLGSRFTSQFYVYNSSDLTVERIINVPSATTRTRDIQFDAIGNVYLSAETNVIQVYSPKFEFIKQITYSAANYIDSFLLQCDGSKIFVDQTRTILLVDRNDDITDTFIFSTSLFSASRPLRTMAITNNGRAIVTNWHDNRVYIF